MKVLRAMTLALILYNMKFVSPPPPLSLRDAPETFPFLIFFIHMKILVFIFEGPIFNVRRDALYNFSLSGGHHYKSYVRS